MKIHEVLGPWQNEAYLQDMLSKMAHEKKMIEHIETTKNYLKKQVQATLASFEDINDAEDAGYYIAIQYIELKARWIQMNLRLSYQAVTLGEGQPDILLKASATAELLAAIEPFVTQSYVQQIQKLLAQPVFGEDRQNAA